MIQIVSNIPIPVRSRPVNEELQALKKLKPGQSFWTGKSEATVRSYASAEKISIAVAKEENGVRVWRRK